MRITVRIFCSGLLLILLARNVCSDVREPAVAGTFYPGNADDLTQSVDRFLGAARSVNEPGRLVALVAPHAGYVFCGDTMGAAFKQIEGATYEVVVLLGAPHRAPVRGASVYDGRAYRTPLGEVPIDREIVTGLLEHDLFRFQPNAHAQEHSLEVLLPFLQRSLGTVPIVPILVGTRDLEEIRRIGRAVVEAISDRNALLVCSSDMSHYPNYPTAIRVDVTTLAALAEFDIEQFIRRTDQIEGMGIPGLSTTWCGRTALVATLVAAREMGANRCRLFRYRNSGDVTAGDKNRVVGYAAAGFYELDGELPPVMPPENPLNEEQKKILLRIARESLEAAVRGKEYTPPEVEDPVLNEHRGAFVTLNVDGKLRGCLGQFLADEPLYRVVANRARASALEDTRFPRVTPEELDSIQVEISALTRMTPLVDFDDLTIGRDGLYVTLGMNRGTLLPQVAWDHGWSPEVFLAQTCQKAGLPLDAWKENARFQRYGADVFGESKPAR